MTGLDARPTLPRRDMRACITVVSVALFLASPTPAVAQSLEAVVDALAPLERLHLAEGEPLKKCFAVLDRRQGQEAQVVAALYRSLSTDVLQVFARNATGDFQVVMEAPEDLAFFGMHCSMQVVEIDGTAGPELLLESSLNRSQEVWTFDWRDGALHNTTPTALVGGRQRSRFVHGELVDVTHDGVATLFTIPNRDLIPHEPGRLYRWTAAGWVLDPATVDIWHVRYGSVWEKRHEARCDAAGGQYVLKLVNGSRGGADRVAGVAVMVNGVAVGGTGGFSAATEFYEIPLGLNLPAGSEIHIAPAGGGAAGILMAVLERR
jgi:hypothetical protein